MRVRCPSCGHRHRVTDKNLVSNSDEMVEAIENAEKPLMASDIAERVGVTKQTVLNYHEQLESSEWIECRKMGQAWVYWPADKFEPPE